MNLTSVDFPEQSEASLDLVEQVLESAEWDYERDADEAIHCIAPVRWGELGGIFTLRHDPSALHFSVTLDVKPTPNRRAMVSDLIVRMNERMSIGHFDFWQDDGLILFRHAIPMENRFEPDAGEVQAVIQTATEAINRFIPALNFVIWAGESPESALKAALFETNGEA